MTPAWTEQHSIDLVEAYIGAEIERSPMGFVWIKGDDWKQPIPDLSKDGEWLMRCLDSVLRQPGVHVSMGRKHFLTMEKKTAMIVSAGLDENVYCMISQHRGIADASAPGIHEALAWALWEARK